jgi:hypothetical protein
MPINSDFNFDDKLSLDNAKLMNRVRLNFLGSQELILRYNGISSAMREDAVEYLEATAERGVASAMPSPTFGFKTYEGDWFCIDIEYNEDSQFIQQRFKIDSQIGDLGDVTETPDYGDQAGDVVRISDGMTLERSYYWRVVNPEGVDLPTARTGEIWTKTSNDNGDGTYDVIISKEVEQDLTARSSVQAGPINGQTINDITIGTCTAFGAYREEIEEHTNSLPYVFSADYLGDPTIEIEEPDAVLGRIKRINNTPRENGLYNVSIITRIAIPQRMPPLNSTQNSLTWDSDYSTGRGGGRIVIGINQSWETLYNELDAIQGGMNEYVVSCSPRINDYGLLDYTISGHV